MSAIIKGLPHVKPSQAVREFKLEYDEAVRRGLINPGEGGGGYAAPVNIDEITQEVINKIPPVDLTHKHDVTVVAQATAQNMQLIASIDGIKTMQIVSEATTSRYGFMSPDQVKKLNAALTEAQVKTVVDSVITTDYIQTTIETIINQGGAQVLQGPQGPQGIQGPQGVQGPAGIDGASIDVKGTIISYTDLPTSGNTKGDTWYVGETGSLYTYSGTKFPAKTDGVHIQGPQGPQGIQGPQGPQGIQGPQGPQGIQGPAGKDGASTSSAGAGTVTADGANAILIRSDYGDLDGCKVAGIYYCENVNALYSTPALPSAVYNFTKAGTLRVHGPYGTSTAKTIIQELVTGIGIWTRYYNYTNNTWSSWTK